MKKYILLLAALAFFFALASVASSGFASVLCGLFAAMLGVCAYSVSSNALVDANNNPIPKPTDKVKRSQLTQIPA